MEMGMGDAEFLDWFMGEIAVQKIKDESSVSDRTPDKPLSLNASLNSCSQRSSISGHLQTSQRRITRYEDLLIRLCI